MRMHVYVRDIPRKRKLGRGTNILDKNNKSGQRLLHFIVEVGQMRGDFHTFLPKF